LVHLPRVTLEVSPLTNAFVFVASVLGRSSSLQSYEYDAEEFEVCCLQASVTATRKEQHTAAKTTRPGQEKLSLGTSVRPLRSLRQQVIAVLYCVCWRVQQS
jgi:hypothetical protein